MTDTITMSFDEWVKEFKPVQNHIWTFIESDGVFCVSEGMHIVNRLGYVITEKPYAENTFYVIEDDD